MASSPDPGPHQVVHAFLSHRYAAYDVNLYFYDLIGTLADFTFSVDQGQGSTSTTRLERMIRGAEVFVGFWPAPAAPLESVSAEELAHASRYFRLELDMAIRAGKPAIAFCDRRYGALFQAPPEVRLLRYDAQEIGYGRRSPSWAAMTRSAASFWGEVGPLLDAQRGMSPAEAGRVGILIAPDADDDPAAIAAAAVTAAAFEPVRLPWPPRLSPSYLTLLRTCDWLVADMSDPVAETLTAFLHGTFTPLLRIQREPAPSELSPVAALLYGALEVGYRKDVTIWGTAEVLRAGLDERISVIAQNPTLFGDRDAANRYFASARKRKERVFLSYAKHDAAQAADLAGELRLRYEHVFDYKDPSSIEAGNDWRSEIAASIRKASIGVILFSEHYEPSGACKYEMLRLLDARDAETLKKLLVIRASGSEAKVPDELATIQYVRFGDGTPAQLLDQHLPASD
jgi:hypothetical protein